MFSQATSYPGVVHNAPLHLHYDPEVGRALPDRERKLDSEKLGRFPGSHGHQKVGFGFQLGLSGSEVPTASSHIIRHVCVVRPTDSQLQAFGGEEVVRDPSVAPPSEEIWPNWTELGWLTRK